MTPRSLLKILIPVLLIPSVYGVLRNITVDDSDSQILYVGDAWKQAPCAKEGCNADPTPNNVYQRTWHDTSAIGDSTSSASITFEGSAIYVQVILPGSGHPKLDDLNLDWQFIMDGQPDGSYNQPAQAIPGDGWGYGFIPYSNTELTYGQHTFVIQIGPTSGQLDLLLLDAFIYSVDDDPPINPQNPPATVTVTTENTISRFPQLTTSSLASPVPPSGTKKSVGPSSSQPSQTTNSTVSGSSIQSVPTIRTPPLSIVSSSSSDLAVATGAPVQTSTPGQRAKTTTIIAAVLSTVIGLLVICICIFLLKRRRRPASSLISPVQTMRTSRASLPLSHVPTMRNSHVSLLFLPVPNMRNSDNQIPHFDSTPQSYTSEMPLVGSFYSNIPNSDLSRFDAHSTRSSISVYTQATGPTLPPYLANHVTESASAALSTSDIATLPPYTGRRSSWDKGQSIE